MRFVDRIEAVGTAVANEQVTLSAPVTERIVRLNFDDGGFVRRGQVVAVLQQAQQTAELREIQARSREAQQQLQRVEALKNRGFATRADYDSRVAAAAAARAQAQGSRARDRRPGDPRALLRLGQPCATSRSARSPARARRSPRSATSTRSSSISPCPRRCSPRSAPGLTIEARSAAYPDRPFNGTIHTIDTVVDPNTRAVTVRARLPNPDRLLRPGMMLNVGIENAPRIGLSVPELAVIGEGDSRFVYVVDGEGKARAPAGPHRRPDGRPDRDPAGAAARPAGGHRRRGQGRRRHGRCGSPASGSRGPARSRGRRSRGARAARR